jgi:hypothetical protein
MVDLNDRVGFLSLNTIAKYYHNYISYPFGQVRTWLKLVSWFRHRSELHGCVFVAVNLDSFTDMQRKGLEFYNGGCVLPRLFVGLTRFGSLVGVFSCVVYT